MELLAVEDLTFSYPAADRAALRHVDLSVSAGEYLCVCGRSGCGKTTLLRHLKSALVPHGERSGAVLFEGVPLSEMPAREQAMRIGVVMQCPDEQIVTDKVWHELAFGLESLGCDQAVMRTRVAEMASYFGIQGWFRKSVAELSGGEKQLLNLASVMAMHPDVLVLDEPTSQLDPIAAADFLGTVRKLNLELGTTVVIAEHRLEDVYAVADRVVVMEEGSVIADAPPRDAAELLYRTGNAMTCALPAPVRVFHGVAEAEGASDQPPCDCPLSVREGRTWLAERVRANALAPDSLPDPAYEPAADLALRVEGVWSRYRKDAPDVLRDVSLDVPAGQLLAIVGGNGVGKSTLLKCMCGIVKPYRGKVRVLGRRLEQWKGGDLFRGGIALLPQDPRNLFAKRTVEAELEEMLSEGSSPASERRARIDEVIRALNLEDLTRSHPYDLSGGERQRVALAKALLTEPRVLLLDEPTKGIDGFFKRELAAMLRELCDAGVTVVMVSHDVEFCARHADSVSMLFDGSIVTTNTPRRFFSLNSFYTTAANRMSRNVFANAITDEDVIELCLR